MPTIAVGRLPARSAKEAEQMVRKIIAFERDGQPHELVYAIVDGR